MKNYLLSFFILSAFAVYAMLFTSCANIVPPTGGPRDSLPPVLLSANPKDSALNFKAKTITLTFDEYVDVDAKVQTEMIVSPNPQQMPFVQGKLRDVSIRLKDSLLPNTTYSINFGRNIKDVNEGNSNKNFTYVFSTGNYITTGKISGRVQLSQTGAVDSTLLVVLHNNLNDSAIKKLRPLYYARLDSSGNFQFNYLPPSNYAIYVVPDDYTKRYDDSTKMFAFSNDTLHLDSNGSISSIDLYAYQEVAPGPQKNNSSSQTNSRNRDEDKSKNRRKNNDNNKDSVPHLAYKTSISGKQDLLSDLQFSFADSLASFDSSKIILADTNYKTIANYRVSLDTSNIIHLVYPWVEEQYFKLIVLPGAFTDSAAITNKQDTISFETKSEREYGSIMIRFAGLDIAKNPVLQLVQSNQVKDSVPLSGTEFKQKLIAPGEYEVRVLYDNNRDGTWTPGNFILKKQPEIVVRIPEKINIRANWDNEVNIEL